MDTYFIETESLDRDGTKLVSFKETDVPILRIFAQDKNIWLSGQEIIRLQRFLRTLNLSECAHY